MVKPKVYKGSFRVTLELNDLIERSVRARTKNILQEDNITATIIKIEPEGMDGGYICYRIYIEGPNMEGWKERCIDETKV